MTYKEIKELERRILETPFGAIQKEINAGRWEGAKYQAMKFYCSIGAVMFGEHPAITKDGAFIPSRYKVKAGAVGSPQYVKTFFPILLQEMEEQLMQLN